jgi:hypothetical protein
VFVISIGSVDLAVFGERIIGIRKPMNSGRNQTTSKLAMLGLNMKRFDDRFQTSDATGLTPVDSGFCSKWFIIFECGSCSAKACEPPM